MFINFVFSIHHLRNYFWVGELCYYKKYNYNYNILLVHRVQLNLTDCSGCWWNGCGEARKNFEQRARDSYCNSWTFVGTDRSRKSSFEPTRYYKVTKNTKHLYIR